MRRLLLVLATLAGLLARPASLRWAVELVGLALICAGIAAIYGPAAAIVGGLALIAAVEVRG